MMPRNIVFLMCVVIVGCGAPSASDKKRRQENKDKTSRGVNEATKRTTNRASAVPALTVALKDKDQNVRFQSHEGLDDTLRRLPGLG